MEHMGSRAGERTVLFSTFVCALSVLFLWRDGFLKEQLKDWRTAAMFAEAAILFVSLSFLRRFGRREYRAGGILFVASFFLWTHRIFLPIFVSGLWMTGLWIIGEALLFLPRKNGGTICHSPVIRSAQNFLTGCAFYIALVSLLSFTLNGGVGTAKKAAVFSVLLALLYLLFCHIFGGRPITYCERERETISKETAAKEETFERIGIAVLTLLLIHAGRMNITLDYDSLRYGLRSEYVLDSGGGIFQNLGLVNTVYFYPKGLEILALPLSGTVTYGFVLAFSWWCSVFLLLVIREIGCLAKNRTAGNCAALLAASVPGIMNLSTSAKTDMITLLFQLFFVLHVLEGMKRRNKERFSLLAFGFLSLFMTLCFKPTAPVFSGGLVLSLVIFKLGKRGEQRMDEEATKKEIAVKPWILPLVLSVLSVFFVTARTVCLAGYPLVSVFTGIFEKLGFAGRYPFVSSGIHHASGGFSGGIGVAECLRRLFLLLLSPVGEEGLHIRIAWGTPLFLVCLTCIFFCFPLRRERDAEHFLKEALAVQLLLLLISLRFLYQIDGNYYNLSYSLAAITAAVVCETRRKSVISFTFPALLSAAFFTCLTNWSGSRGFTEWKWNHYGFYDHKADVAADMIRKAKEPIYRYLSNAPHIRLLAMSEDPNCYLFPCRVESYADVSGSGGNVFLVKTLHAFKAYLDFSEVSYLYAEETYLKAHERAEEIVRFMEEDGSIVPLISQEGNTLYAYRKADGN